jgi:hypothetical protein
MDSKALRQVPVIGKEGENKMLGQQTPNMMIGMEGRHSEPERRVGRKLFS